jgi:hypothetical protein
MATFDDDFNRADNPDLGPNWTPLPGADGFSPLEIFSNEARRPVGAGDAGELAVASLGSNQYARVRIDAITGTGEIEISALTRGNGTSPHSLYACAAHRNRPGVTSRIRLVNAGTPSDLVTENATTWAATDLLTGIVRGSGLALYRNVVRLLAATNTTLTSGQVGAIVANDAVSSADAMVDDFASGDLPLVTPLPSTAVAAASGNITLVDTGITWATDDLGIALIHTSDQNALSMDAALTPIAQGNGGGTTSRLAAFWFRYAGSVPSLLVTHTGGQSPIGYVVRVRSNVAGQRVSVKSVSSITAGTDASIEHASVTPDADFQLALFCNGGADDNARTLPAGLTLVQTSLTTAGTPNGSVSMMCRDILNGEAVGVTTVTQAAADPWASVTIRLGLEAIPVVPVEESITFDVTTAIAPARRAIIGAGMALTTAATVQPPSRLQANALASLSAQASLTPSSLLTTAAALALGGSAALTPAGSKALQASLALQAASATAAAAQTAILGALSLTSDATLDVDARLIALAETELTAIGLQDVMSTLSLEALLALGAEAAVTPAARFTAQNLLSLSVASTYALASQMTTSALHAFTVNAGLDAFTGSQVIQEQLELSLSATAVPTSRAVAIAQHTLALSASLNVAGRAVVRAAAAYAAHASVSGLATADIAGRLALEIDAVVTSRSQATVRQGILLAIASSLQTAATLADQPTASLLQATGDQLRAAAVVDETFTAADVIEETLQ